MIYLKNLEDFSWFFTNLPTFKESVVIPIKNKQSAVLISFGHYIELRKAARQGREMITFTLDIPNDIHTALMKICKLDEVAIADLIEKAQSDTRTQLIEGKIMAKTLLTAEKAAEYIGISPATFHANIKKLIPSHKIGFRKKYDTKDLDLYVQRSKEAEPCQDPSKVNSKSQGRGQGSSSGRIPQTSIRTASPYPAKGTLEEALKLIT